MKKIKKRYFAYAVLPVMALALMGAGTVSAHGWFGGPFGVTNATPQEVAQRQNEMFTQKANLLGMSVDEVKSAWAQGKTLQQLAEEKGITQDQLQEKMRELRQQQIKERLQTLVEQGVITQTQADQRLQFMQRQMENNAMGKAFRHGLGHGWRF